MHFLPASGILAEPHGKQLQMNSGETVSHYRILSELGSGGMGVVYLAEDLLLGRKIALKFLSRDFARDPIAVERFRREARAASALNHPGICTIHEISEHDGQPFIAMEHLEGQSLRDLLRERRISLDELLAAAIDVAEALDAAHRVGVVHRDVKPGNVFVLARHRAKLLDFGLAKMEVASSDVAMAPTRDVSHLTNAGITLGTVAYMSPEQARGDALDARSDLFSFGVLLYEMATGVLPFRGSSTAVLFHEILGKTPVRPLHLNPDIPPDLDRLIMKALEKDRDVRCQSAAEMLSDLKRLKRDRDSGQPASANATSVSVSATPPAQAAAASAPESSSSDVQVAAALLKRHRLVVAVAAITVILALGGLFWFVADRGPAPSAALPAQDMQVQQITTSGNAARPAISPDGKFVSYISGGGVWVRQTETSSNVQLVPQDAAYGIGGMTITPDNNFVDFLRVPRTAANPPSLWRVPLLGGTAKLLLENAHSLVGWSPDGKRIAFIRSNSATNPTSLVVADADGGNETVLLTRQAPDLRLATILMPAAAGVAPAWSPDGGIVAYPTNGPPSDPAKGSVVFVNVSDKTVQTIDAGTVNGLGWLDDSSLLIARSDSNGLQLWRMSYPDGKFTRVTNDVNSYQGISVGAQRTTWVTSRTEEHAALWVGNGTATEGKEIPQPGLAGVQHSLTWLGDRLFFSSRGTLYSMLADGQPEEFLKNATSQTFTSDGKTIVYYSELSNTGIWKADSNGRNPVRLFEGGSYWPVITPDDKNVIYESFGGGKLQLWIVPLDGGDPRLLNPAEAAHPRISPDGKMLAFGSREKEQWYLSVCDLPECAQVRHVRPMNIRIFNLQWMPDGRAIALNMPTGGAANLMIQPLDGSPERQLTHFSDGKTIYDFAWSADGKNLAITRSSTSQDIVLFRNAAKP
jgi:serine/threonine protein kinase/Tol biopolymer transport system component